MRFGCNKEIEVSVPSGWDYKMIKTRCGSTSYTGGVNQCDECSKREDMSYVQPYEDESDMDWYERNALSHEGGEY